jgi:hypothetical protein
VLLVFNRLTAGLSEVRFGILLGFETHSKCATSYTLPADENFDLAEFLA